MTKATSGFILRQHPIGESSVYATFFTQDRGLIKARVKGGRSPKRRAMLQPFIPLWVEFQEKSVTTYVQQVEVAANPIILSGNYLFAGFYVNELLCYLLQPAQEELFLFELYKKTMFQLSQADSKVTLERTLRQFEWLLLETLGFQVSFSYEIDGSSPIQSDQCYNFIPGEGFIRTSQGINGAHLLTMAEQNYESISVLKTAKWIMRRAIDHLLDGRPIRSRELYRS